MARYIETLETEFTDRANIGLNAAVFEYGIIRNPKNGLTLFKQGDDYCAVTISLLDIKEALKDASEGFFDYIGSELGTELERLDNNTLALMIQSLNAYSKIYYNASTRFISLKELLRSFD